MELVRNRISIFNYIVAFGISLLVSCVDNSEQRVTSISLSASPVNINNGIEAFESEIYYSTGLEFIDSLRNFNSVKVSKITSDEFQKIVNLVVSSDLVNGVTGDYTIGAKLFCVDIEYSNGFQKRFEKVSLTSKDYKVFNSILSFSNPHWKSKVGYKFRTLDCAINLVPNKIQQAEQILIPSDSID